MYLNSKTNIIEHDKKSSCSKQKLLDTGVADQFYMFQYHFDVHMCVFAELKKKECSIRYSHKAQQYTNITYP